MKTDELVKRLREYTEWARANEWEVPITLADALEAAADTIERLDNFVDSKCCRLPGCRCRNRRKINFVTSRK